MKRKHIILFIASLLLAGCTAGPALPDAESPDKPVYGIPQELAVTIKQDSNGTVFFENGKYGRIYPGEGYPFEEQCRALGSITIYAEEVPSYGHRCEVHWLEPIDAGRVYGMPFDLDAVQDAGLDVIWAGGITSVDDGYLTVQYNAWWGDPVAEPHEFSLVYVGDGEFTLIHDARGDGRDVYAPGIVYFDINSMIPDTGGLRVAVNVSWKTTQGQTDSKTFGFISRK